MVPHPHWLWIALKRVRVNDYVALPVVGVAGAMTNTVLVMGSIYFLLAQQYAEVKMWRWTRCLGW